MTDLIQRLRSAGDALASEAADNIERLGKRAVDQQTIMDKASSIMLEAILSDDGIDEGAADACMDAISGNLEEVGRTTTETYLQRIYDRISAAAGFSPGTEFNPLHVIDQMRLTIAAQSRNGQLLEWALGRIWMPGSETVHPTLLVSRLGDLAELRTFAPGTGWSEALHAAMSEASFTAKAT